MGTEGSMVELGIVGLGVRTEVLLVSLFALEGVKVTAICDLSDEAIALILELFKKAGRPAPAVHKDYRELLQRRDVQAILTPTSWNTHLPIATAALRAGKHVAFEVGGASSTEELWQLVQAAEETDAQCMMLENCCYSRDEMMVLNMVRQGLFGELIHCEGGYEHDLRSGVADNWQTKERSLHNRYRNCDLYPTHALGPLSKILGINRGNRFLSLVSVASKSRGQQEYNRQYAAAGKPAAGDGMAKGDVISTIITCAGGETIVLKHSISLPRPYSRNTCVQGTKGLWLENANGIYIEGISQTSEKIDVAGHPYSVHHWDPVSKFYATHDHPLWREYHDQIIGGHGGNDALALQAFLYAVRNGIETPIDVYDCAAWMSVTCLSEQSIALGGHPLPFPDFTNGKWIRRNPAPAHRYSLDNVYPECFMGTAGTGAC